MSSSAESWPHRCRRERRDAAEHRQQILDAARQLFATQGVEATSMAEIARMAQVGQGTLYRRFAHKGHLAEALMANNVEVFRQQAAELIHNQQASSLCRLEALLVAFATFNEANAPLLGAIEDAACGERRGGFYQTPLYRWIYDTAVTLLRQAEVAGETNPLDAEAIADVVLAPLNLDLYLYQRHSRHYDLERILAAQRQVLFEGLRRR